MQLGSIYLSFTFFYFLPPTDPFSHIPNVNLPPVRVLFSMDLFALYVFRSIRTICTISLCLVSLVVTYHPVPTFVNHLVRNSLSLIYNGIRLYSRVTNLGPEGKQTLRHLFIINHFPPCHGIETCFLVHWLYFACSAIKSAR